MLRAVLFDLDGTLLDTLGDIQKTLNESLELFGFPTVSREQTETLIGDGAEMLVKRAVNDAENWEEVYAHFRVRYRECDNALTTPYEGAVVLLKKLQANGVKVGVVTNKPHEAAKVVLAQKFPEIAFDVILGDSGAFPVKPDPTPARFAALTMRVAAGECAFVGDGETDVLTAKNAGMAGIACVWGYRSEEQLKEVGATRFAHSFAQLESILTSL